jgi:ABC-type transport system involved in multi-copper enzyme maturation permease subunit
MSFLPIVTRELRSRARSKWTYWWRCGSALVASGIASVMMVVGLFLRPGAAGKGLFVTMAWMAWVFCLVEGVRHTADCLSEEKREGTIGLLFLTDLKGYDVVLGKLMGAGLGAFFSLLAALPVLGLALMLGGVTAGEFWRMCLALSITLFLSLSAGLLVSALSRQERRAWAGALLLTGFLTVVVPMGQFLQGPAWAALQAMSPQTLFRGAFEAEYVLKASPFWNAALGVFLTAVLCLALASLLLPGVWQEKGDRRLPGGWLLPARSVGRTAKAAAKEMERRSLNPVYWLAVREGSRGRILWLVAGGLSLGGLMAGGAALSQPSRLVGLWICGLGVHLVATLWVAWEACHSFTRLRQSGMLELLLATPLPTFLLVEGERAALRRLFLWPVVLLGGVELALAGVLSVLQLGPGATADAVVTIVLASLLVGGGLGLWVMDMMAVALVGMWLSLVSRNPAQAWARTVLWVLIGPLFLLLFSAMICCGGLAPFLILGKDLLFINWANRNLRLRLREVAADPLAVPRWSGKAN